MAFRKNKKSQQERPSQQEMEQQQAEEELQEAAEAQQGPVDRPTQALAGVARKKNNSSNQFVKKHS